MQGLSRIEPTAKDSQLITDEARDFLLGGGGPPSVKFPEPGAKVTGKIVRAEPRQRLDIEQRPMFWEDGKPQMQLVIWLQTTERDPSLEDDDGMRRLFASGSKKPESKSMLGAIIEAVRKAGDIQVGGTLTVQYTGDGPRNAQRPALNPPKQYKAIYQPPTISADDLI